MAGRTRHRKSTVRSRGPRTARLIDGLSQIKGLKVYGDRPAESRVAVVSIALAGYDPQELATTLDGSFRVQARAGLHCPADASGASARWPRAERCGSAPVH